jgi:hypothetical protein
MSDPFAFVTFSQADGDIRWLELQKASPAMTLPERIELLARVLSRAKHDGSEAYWANYKAMAERLLSEEYAEVLRKVMQ